MLLQRKSTLLLCCLTRKVGISTKNASIWSHIRNTSASIWQKIGSNVRFIMYPSKDLRFMEEVIQRMHKRDKMSQTEWVLIYNDLDYSRLCAFVMFFSFAAVFTATFITWDKLENKGVIFEEKIKRARRHIYELGVVMYLLYTIIPITLSITFRLLQLRMYRVYQNIMDPYKYNAVVSRFYLFSEKVEFPRDSFKTTEIVYDNQNQDLNKIYGILRRLIYGHAKLNGRKFVIEQDAFKSNSLGTFMMHDTHSIPRLK